MANNTINTRIVTKNDTSTNWEVSTLILLKGEMAIATDLNKVKIGDGEHTWKDLPYLGATAEEILAAVNAVYQDDDGKIKESLINRNQVLEYTDTTSLAEFKHRWGSTWENVLSETANETAADSGKTIRVGDLMIMKFPIKNSTESTATIIDYSYILMYCNSAPIGGGPTSWKRITFAYEAEDVYMTNDLTITANVGVQTIDKTGSKTLDTKGKNIKQVFDMLFAEEKDPTVTNPSISALTLKHNGNNAATKYEVGTTIIPSYSATFNAGSYSYGPATGCTVSTWHVDDSLTGTGHTELATNSGSFDNFVITDGQIYKITATADYTAGTTPVTNLGNNAASKKINAGTTAEKTSNTITGYREGFFYGRSTSALSAGDITSTIIRSLSKTGAAYAKGNKTYTVPVGAATIILACPSNKTGVTKILNTTVNADMTEAFGSPTVVTVAGADGDTSSAYATTYNVWTYTPAEAYGSTASLTITLG